MTILEGNLINYLHLTFHKSPSHAIILGHFYINFLTLLPPPPMNNSNVSTCFQDQTICAGLNSIFIIILVQNLTYCEEQMEKSLLLSIRLKVLLVGFNMGDYDLLTHCLANVGIQRTAINSWFPISMVRDRGWC